MRLITQELSRSQFRQQAPSCASRRANPAHSAGASYPVFARARKKANFFGSLNFTWNLVPFSISRHLIRTISKNILSSQFSSNVAGYDW